MAVEIEQRCARLLRELRRQRGLTLHEFEEFSKGEVKAVVLGSYERGTRAISLARLAQLADLYEVPVEYFFNTKGAENNPNPGRFICDIRRIRKLESLEAELEITKRFLSGIAAQRNDWNCEVISLRTSDAIFLAMVSGFELSDFTEKLKIAGFLFASEVSEQRSL